MGPFELRRLVALAALAAVATVGVAACGDDDDSAAGPEFCDALVAFNEAASSTDFAEDASADDVRAAGDQLIPLWDAVRNNAPDDLSDVVTPLNGPIDALGEGDPAPFNADETFEAYNAFVGEAIDQCDFDTTSVTAVDYAFEDLPESLSAGPAVIELKNESGAEDHELIAFRKTDPEQPTEEIFEMSDEELGEAITFAGFVMAPADETARSLFSFEPGSYVAVCFIPVGGGEDGPPHFTEGMLAEFTVG